MNRIRTALLTGAAFALVAAVSPSYADSNRYDAKVLVADIPPAPHLDPHLVNGWGVAFNRNPNGFVWVSDNGTGVATLYDGLGNPQSLVVTIPAVPGSDHGTPTGIVFNTSAFAVSSAGKTGSSAFIFATEDGLIAGWSPGVDFTHAIQAYPPAGVAPTAVYKGLALDTATQRLFAANFTENQVEVYDTGFNLVNTFTDPTLPKRFAPFNVVDYAPLLRAALVNLDRWVTEGVEPPASNVPRLADGTAVVAETTAALFAKLPGVRFPDRIERPVRLDFGPELGHGVVTELPPKVGAPFVTFVSAVDADGNEIAGVRPVELLAPLATFTGWNPRHPEQGAPGDLMSMMGSTLPFPRTRAERLATDDPRRSIEERYPSRAAYLEKARVAALALVAARHVLAEDLDPLVERAGRLWDWVHARV